MTYVNLYCSSLEAISGSKQGMMSICKHGQCNMHAWKPIVCCAVQIEPARLCFNNRALYEMLEFVLPASLRAASTMHIMFGPLNIQIGSYCAG